MPEQRAAVVLLTNGSTGRAMYRSLFADLIDPSFGITFPPLHLDLSTAAAGELSRFAGIYAWPDRRVEVTATARGLLIATGSEKTEALKVGERTFLIDGRDPDDPTIRRSGHSTETADRMCSTGCLLGAPAYRGRA